MKKIYLLLISVFILNTAYTQYWTQQTSGLTSSLNGIFFTSDNTGYTCGDAGKILKTTNGGTNWSALTSGTTSQLNGVFFTSSSTGYVVGASGLIRQTTNSGTNWSTQTTPTTQYLYGVHFYDANNGYACGWNGTILKTTNAGTNWTSVGSGSYTLPLYSVFFTSANTGYAVGGNGSSSIILKTTNGGTNWTQQTCAATNTLRSVFFTGVDTGYVAGYGGLLYKTTDGGTTWTSQNSSTSLNIQSLFFPNNTTGYGACASGYVLKTKNGGTTWNATATSVSDVLMSVYFTQTNLGYICGAAGIILKTTTGGEACSLVAQAGNNQAICTSQSATLTATGGDSYSWSSGGSTATIVVSPASTTVYTVTVSSGTCTATDNVTVSVTSGGPASVSITASPSGSICAGTSVTFTATPTNGGTPAYQWKDNGTDISGATNSTYITTALTSSDAITCVMTSSLSCATGSPATSNSITKTVYPTVPVSVSIAANPSGGICTGNSVTFTATATNGGGNPSYQWKKNGSNIAGQTTSVYTSASLANGDIITCVLTSSVSCPSGSPATSNAITLVVASSLPASVNIAANPGSTICSGSSVTFTATATNGGAPTYQWKNNGSNITGATNSTYTSSTLANNDQITCVMTSSLSCATGSPATSNTITMTVSTSVNASVSINAAPGISVCEGVSVTFSATPVNGGSSPSYQWLLNGGNITGATNSTYTSTTLADNDAIACVMTSNASCASGSPATSNTLTMTVYPIVPATVSISANPSGAICSGTNVTFTAAAANGGTSPTYQWQNNGVSITGATNSTYSSSALADTDIITCIMASSQPCVTGSPDTSNAITMVVNPNAATISSDTAICQGGFATITAGGGGTYSWSTSATTQYIIVSPLTTTTYTVTVTNGACTASADATVTVNSVSASAGNDQTICPGQSATLTASGGGTYLWSTSATTQSINVTPSSTTTYTVTVTNGGCTASDAVQVTLSIVAAEAGSDQTVCSGDTAVLSGSGGSMYSWSGGVLDSQPFVPTATTTYTVTVYNGFGCSGTDNVVITVLPSPPTPVIIQNGNVLISSADNMNQWYHNDTLISGATDTSYTCTENGSYYVIVTLNGCSATSNVIVFYLGLNEYLWENNFTIYPNPAVDAIEINVPEKCEIEILNIEGQVIKRFAANGSASLDISYLPGGMYMLKANSDSHIAVRKFVKE